MGDGPVLALPRSRSIFMHNLFFNLVICGLASSTLQAQSSFPQIVGETTEGNSVTLPDNSGSDYTIVALAYGKKAEPLLERWYGPAYSRFIAKNGLFAATYHAELYLVPIFVGLNRSAYNGSMNRLRKEVDPEIARRVIFVKDDPRDLIRTLDMTDKDIPYFFVLDRNGKILQRVSGAFSVDQLDALEAPMLK